MEMIINYKKLSKTANIPVRGSKYSAGYDLSADIGDDMLIRPGETLKIPTGLAIELPDGYCGLIYARSGLATKEGLRPANCVGVIDSDYRGEYIVALHNDSNDTRVIRPGQRIAQLVVVPYLQYDFVEVDTLSETERNTGGFGSTGK